jgi:hypothetical protein
MKRILYFLLCLVLSGVAAAQDDPVLMRINGKPVSRSEFEYIYNKNRSISGIEQLSLRDYIALFQNYKLKVAEAEAMSLDTTVAFKNELSGYRQQVAQSYLTDPAEDDRVAHLVYDSLKQAGEIKDPRMTYEQMKPGIMRYCSRIDGYTPGEKKVIAGLRKGYNLSADMSNRDVLAYEDARLEKNYPDFGHLMGEYRDGILLFDVSSLKVWNKAAADSIGLVNFFKKNKKNYSWAIPHYKGVIVLCNDKSIYKKIRRMLKHVPFYQWKQTLDRQIAPKDSVEVECGLFVPGDNHYIDRLKFGKEDTTVPTHRYVKTIGRMLKKGPQEFQDVRGPVVSDYQNYLEKQWIEELRGKYKVEINEQVLKTVNDHSDN